MEFSFTESHSLETLTEYTREYASELAKNNATIQEEVLTARIHIENAHEATTIETQQTELDTALEAIELAQQIDSINNEYETELTNLAKAINRAKATL